MQGAGKGQSFTGPDLAVADAGGHRAKKAVATSWSPTVPVKGGSGDSEDEDGFLAFLKDGGADPETCDRDRSLAATVSPTLSHTKRDMGVNPLVEKRPSMSDDCMLQKSGSIDSQGLEAMLYLIETQKNPSASPRRSNRSSRTDRSHADLECIFDMDLPGSRADSMPSRRASEDEAATPASSKQRRHRVSSLPNSGSDSPLPNSSFAIDKKLAVRARREMWRLNREEIVLEEKLGEGDCAVVHKAKWRGMDVVSKQLRDVSEYTAIGSKPGDSPPTASCLSAEKARADLANEIQILSHLRHPNLVLFLGACLNDKGGVICLVSEYMEGGTLEGLYHREATALGHPYCPPRKQVLAWAQDLSQALCFLHNCDHPVIHRDIKPANLLLCRGILKVGDFSLSRATGTHERNKAYRMTGRTGTMRYMAPEVMMMESDGCSSYDEKVDIYSAACIMWFMCMGEKPFGNLPAVTVMEGVTRGLRPDLYSVEHKHGRDMAELISNGWAMDPRDRMSGEEMVARVKMARDATEVRVGGEQRKSSGGRASSYMASPLTHAKNMWSMVTGGSRSSRGGRGSSFEEETCRDTLAKH